VQILGLVSEVVWYVKEGMLTFDIGVDVDNDLCRLQDRNMIAAMFTFKIDRLEA